MTLMSSLGRSPRLRGVWLPLEVSEHRARIDPQITRRSRSIAAVSLEDFENVLPREVLPCLRERDDRALLIAAQVEVFCSDQSLVRKHDRLLDAVLQLADVARPVVSRASPRVPWV